MPPCGNPTVGYIIDEPAFAKATARQASGSVTPSSAKTSDRPFFRSLAVEIVLATLGVASWAPVSR
jgi:hypothetical protein